jgi:hypothetical protein
MKRSLAIIISLIFVISALFIFSTCGGGGAPEPPSGYTTTEDLGGGVKVTINSPVQVTCNTNPAAGSYNDGWSKVPEMEITGALGAGQVMTLTYESPGGFESEDEIAYVDSDGNWIPVDSNIKQVGDTISASVDQCNTVFGAGPVYTLGVTVNYDPSASVDEDHPIYIGAFCVNWADPEPYESEPITSSGGSYTFELPSEDYVLFIFLDENNNGEPDIGEPYQFYDGSENETGATAITVDIDQTVTVNLDDTYMYPAIGSVSITFPSGQTLSSDFTATGTYSGDVNSIDVQIDGTPEGSAVLNAVAETWSCDVSVSGLTETAHTITVNAYYNSTLLDSDDSSFTYSSTPVNNDPALSNGYVDPTSGTTSDTFTYSVDYDDIDGDAPATIQVFIDGSPNTMTLDTGDAWDGTYTYAVSGAVLTEGTHTYYFSCTDGNGGSALLPLTGTETGPTVTSTGPGTYTLSGTVNYTGSEIISSTCPLVLDVGSERQIFTSDSNSYVFSFDLSPDTYLATVFIDRDYDEIDPFYEPDVTEGDIYVIYDGEYTWGMYGYTTWDLIDLTMSDQQITINLSDAYEFGFYEDFEDGIADGWIASDDRWTVTGGQYFMVGETPSSEQLPAYSLYDEDDISDFTFSVQLDQTQGDYYNGDWGILFRFDPYTLSGYALWVWEYGWWGLEALDEGDFYSIHEEGTFSPGDEVSVECIGDTLSVYINGVNVWDYDLSAYPNIPTEGYVGLYGWDDSEVAEDNVFVFDNAWLIYHH